MWQAAILTYSRKATETGNLPGWGGSTVDLPAVADVQHQDNDTVVLDIADDPMVADTIPPKVLKSRSLEWRTKAARILSCQQAMLEELRDSRYIVLTEPLELLQHSLIELKRPGQVRASALPGKVYATCPA